MDRTRQREQTVCVSVGFASEHSPTARMLTFVAARANNQLDTTNTALTENCHCLLTKSSSATRLNLAAAESTCTCRTHSRMANKQGRAAPPLYVLPQAKYQEPLCWRCNPKTTALDARLYCCGLHVGSDPGHPHSTTVIASCPTHRTNIEFLP